MGSKNIKITITKLMLIRLIAASFVIIATFTNNYFFYEHIERDSEREIIHTAKIINSYSNLCLLSKMNQKICIERIEQLLKETPTYYGFAAILRDYNNNILLKYDSRQYEEDTRSLTSLSKMSNETILKYERNNSQNSNIQPLELTNQLMHIKDINATLEVLKTTHPNIWITVFRSLSFSIADWVPKIFNGNFKDAISDVLNIAIPRSWPAFIFILLTFLLYKLIKLEHGALTQRLHELDQEIYEGVHAKGVDFDTVIIPEKLRIYEHITKPILDSSMYQKLVNISPKTIVLDCRSIAESLIIDIYDKNPSSEYKKSFKDKVDYLFYTKKLINFKSKTHLDHIRSIGNITAHLSIKNYTTVSEDDAYISINALLLVIEDFDKNNLLY